MNIQGYPGHMTKTRRQIEADLKYVDIVVEITDARIPVSSRNPDIDAICAGKPRLIVLNRADQADPSRLGCGPLASKERGTAYWKQTPSPAGASTSFLRSCKGR